MKIRFELLLMLSIAMPLTPAAGSWPADVEATLATAGTNRGELESVLAHYQQLGDAQKLDAAQWLIANMDGHGFALNAFFTADQREVPFDALDYPDFASAQAAMDALEKKHGHLDYGKKRLEVDAATLNAKLLLENIDQAFEAWRDRPWSHGMSYETFRDYVLPYRGSEEPAKSFRPWMRQRYADLAARMKDPRDPREAASLIRADVDRLIGFSELYYLHPTDQAFDEMLARKLGRCEDITNMVMYAWRANAIAAASDYTPAWADRDNNHAWEVVLDDQGHGHAGLGSRAAKVYRKMFAGQATALGTLLRGDETAPRWLHGRNYADVTEQYQPVSDVTVRLLEPPRNGERFAYICVFNGGEWTPIHYGQVMDGARVTFTKMGRNIAYLPAWYRDEQLVPAGPPLILDSQGQVVTLSGDSGPGVSIEITVTTPEVVDADTRGIKPRVTVQPDVAYEFFSWNPARNGWESHGRQTAHADPVAVNNIPPNRLYWLKSDEGRELERIFTIEQGRQAWY